VKGISLGRLAEDASDEVAVDASDNQRQMQVMTGSHAPAKLLRVIVGFTRLCQRPQALEVKKDGFFYQRRSNSK